MRNALFIFTWLAWFYEALSQNLNVAVPNVRGAYRGTAASWGWSVFAVVFFGLAVYGAAKLVGL